MPLIKIKNKPDYIYGIWAIEESIDILYNTLETTEKERDYLNQISHLQRKKQSIAAKIILNNLANQKVHVLYNQNGNPFSKNHKNISISHSNNLSIALISEDVIGIDIQLRNRKIHLIQSKFINKADLKTRFKSEDSLHQIWCAKEAIYKTLNGLPCSFKKIFLSKI